MEMVQLLAQADAEGTIALSKGIMLGIAFGAAALGLAILGANYMKALGRNPEAGKTANAIIIIAAMIEVTALLAFLLGAFLF